VLGDAGNGGSGSEAPYCGDGADNAPGEECDDGNLDETDGCTSACVVGAICDALHIPAADRFAVDPATGHCYAALDDLQQTWANAQVTCTDALGHLATITAADEDLVVSSILSNTQIAWLGASDDGNDTDTVFDWVTAEPWGFVHFADGQPDDDAGLDGLGECLFVSPNGEWADTNCDFVGLVTGLICEIEP
jgi:cysteine-rich repeat protein